MDVRSVALVVSSFAAATLALSFAAPSAEAKVWDAVADFGVEDGNPNGEWTYGWMDTGFATFTPFTQHSPTNGPGWYGWYGWGSDSTPHIALNEGLVEPGVLAMHPGNGQQPMVLRWTAPTYVSGDASIVGQFLPGDSGQMLVAIRKDNSTTLWSASDHGAFNLNTAVSPGTTIDFAVYGGYAYGNTGFVATITAVPEPGVIMLAGGTTVAALGLRRRRGA